MEHVGSVERVTITASGPSRAYRGAPWWAVASAALAPVALTAGWVVAGAIQPPEYSAVRQSLSALAGHGGAERWIMTTSLFVLGACHVVTALGLSALRPAARMVLGGAGISGIALAALPQPANGSATSHVASVVVGSVLIATFPAFVGSRSRPQSFALSVRGSADRDHGVRGTDRGVPDLGAGWAVFRAGRAGGLDARDDMASCRGPRLTA